MNYKSLYSLRVAVLIAWGLALLVILLLIGPQRIWDSYRQFTPGSIDDFVASFGLWAAIAYLLLQSFRSFLFLPVTPLTIAGGYLFGPFLGFGLTIAGRTVISATITFYLSRHLLRDYVQSKIKDRYPGWDRRLEKNGIFYVIVMRVIPFLPFDVVGYVAGASNISFRRYMAGTIIGDLPGVVVLTIFGSSLRTPGSRLFYLSIVVAAVAMALSVFYMKMYMDKSKEPAD